MKLSADFPFFQFSFVATLSHRYQDWVRVVRTSMFSKIFWYCEIDTGF